MATSPMRPQYRKKQSWSDNKENKPSPLIDVPPLGPTPMFANSNVSMKNHILKCINCLDFIYSKTHLLHLLQLLFTYSYLHCFFFLFFCLNI